MLDYRFNILYSYTNKKLTLQDISSSQGEGEGEVWFGLVWFGMVWFGMVWHGLVWFNKHEGQKNIGLHDISYSSYSSKLYLSIYIYLSFYLFVKIKK